VRCHRLGDKRDVRYRPGTVINLGSGAGQIGLAGGVACSGTKGRVASLTRSWAAAYSPRGVRIDAIALDRARIGASSRERPHCPGQYPAPGPHGGGGGDRGRHGVPRLPDHITGAVISADGGSTAV
jgi:NAD(P)-dependent dehydrogenase (short-subunit alcohol dehydrogenase family)